jgi:hypothetical protein
VDYRRRRRFKNVFLIGFDPVGGYLALGGLEIQLTGAYELVELPLKRIFHMGVQGEVLVDWGQRLRMEFDPPNDSGIK